LFITDTSFRRFLLALRFRQTLTRRLAAVRLVVGLAFLAVAVAGAGFAGAGTVGVDGAHKEIP